MHEKNKIFNPTEISDTRLYISMDLNYLWAAALTQYPYLLLAFDKLQKQFEKSKKEIKRLFKWLSSWAWLFIDSGGYGFFKNPATRATGGDVYALMRFLEYMREYITAYAALDVIQNPSLSLRNYEIMFKAGFTDGFLTYHFSSPLEELKKLTAMTNRIALGGTADIRSRESWFDDIFAYLSEKNIHYHLFAVSGQKFLQKYNFIESADASSWLVVPSKGGIFLCDNYGKRHTLKVDKLNSNGIAMVNRELLSLGTDMLWSDLV